jgi:Protein of unknown function (DUF 659)/hAT family C-terminal dimerisation region
MDLLDIESEPAMKENEQSETSECSAQTTTTASTSSIKVKRGRDLSNTWVLFTNDPDPQLKKSAVCKHCKILINYHKKSELVHKHLNNCKQFVKLMTGMEINDRPEWFDIRKKLKANPAQVQPHYKQKAITQYTLPPVPERVQAQFEETIALHFYLTGTSFQRVEEKNLAQAIHLLRPDAALPTRQKLAGPLLDECYNHLKKKQDSYMNSPSSCVCLITDGWSNIRNEPIVNYMATSEKTVFLESVATGIQGHTAQWIADDIDRVITKYPHTTFAGAVTDNTAANKAAWEILKGRHPTMFFQGCVSHGLHLMVKDIFAATKTKKPGHLEPSYPIGYPFEEMLQLAIDCKDIVKFFHNHHAVKAKLRQMQETEKLIALAQPASTRWGTLQQCFKSILESERMIYTIVNERNFIIGTAKQKEERQRLKDIIVKDEFISNLKKALRILEPIDELIVKFQSDAVPVSEVVTSFNRLPIKFAEMVDILTQHEIKYLKDLAVARFQLIYGDAHGIGYLLDPRFIGEGLPADDKRALEDKLMSIPADDSTAVTEERKMTLYDQLTKYFITALREKNENTIRYKMLENKRKTPLQYWQSDGTTWPDLQKIALRVFSMSASTAASERNFSTFGFIHSKQRNCLSEASVEKLVFIKTNYNALVGGSDLTVTTLYDSSDDDGDHETGSRSSSSDEIDNV